MRMIIFFDLPMTNANERKIYTTFRKRLTQEGFVMMQQSVYTKLVLNSTNEKSTHDRIKKNNTRKRHSSIIDRNRKSIRIDGISGWKI